MLQFAPTQYLFLSLPLNINRNHDCRVFFYLYECEFWGTSFQCTAFYFIQPKKSKHSAKFSNKWYFFSHNKFTIKRIDSRPVPNPIFFFVIDQISVQICNIKRPKVSVVCRFASWDFWNNLLKIDMGRKRQRENEIESEEHEQVVYNHHLLWSIHWKIPEIIPKRPIRRFEKYCIFTKNDPLAQFIWMNERPCMCVRACVWHGHVEIQVE